MPLRALIGALNVCAYQLDEMEWARLKATYKEQGLRMPCCPSKAIPKTSKLGTQFFAHAGRGECTSAPESAEHLFLKCVIATAGKRAGWEVFTEWPGVSADGERWMADVYCMKGKACIALEVQLSYQPKKDLLRRQRIYARSGVRAAWFVSSAKFGGDYITPSKDLPLFYLQAFSDGVEPEIKQFNVPISHFVIDLLGKKVTWKVDSESTELGIFYLHDTCWRCGRAVKQVYGSGFGVFSETAKTVPNMSTVLSELRTSISNEQLKSHGLNTIGSHGTLKGNAPGFPYCNECIFCGAPQNNHYVMEKRREAAMSGGLQDCVTIAAFEEGIGYWHHER